ncbi:MAG TPA: VWA domain-containing protein [Dehalococcoidia bacterium]
MFDSPYRLADPWLLGLLALVAAVWLLSRRAGRRGGGALIISSVAGLRQAPPSWRIRYRWILTLLRVVAVVLLVFALARPQVGRASAKIPTRGIDVVIALDLSGSMLDPGLSSGSKLDGAKQAIKRFIAQRKNDQVGLVVFESESRVVSPLTNDYHALEQQVDQVKNGLLPDGTAIGLGIADAINLLRGSTAKSKVIILATDGENNQHRLEPEQAVDFAKALDMKLYTIGMLAQNETPSTTQIDERSMQQWAKSTGGFYGRAQSESQLQHIFDTISQLETSQLERNHYTSYEELFGFFLVPALGLVMLEAGLGATVFRRAP